MSKQYFGQKYFGKPLPAGATGGRERSYVQHYGSEVKISSQLDLAQLSSAILKNGENAGPLGQILALTAVMALITACGSAPAAGPEISRTPSLTPDNPTPVLPTHTLTPTSTHTLVPSPTFAPSRTPTYAAPRSESKSQFSAADNNTVVIENGVAKVIEPNFRNRNVNSYKAIKADPNYRFLDYEAARKFNNPPKGLFGDFRLPEGKMADWWEKEGGLGFTLDDPIYFGSEAFVKPVDSLLVKNKDDGFHRAGIVIPQKDFEVGLIQVARVAAKQRWSSEDFTKFGPGSALASHDKDIRELFEQMLSDSGYRPIGRGNWPGPVDLASLSNDELSATVGDGNVCIEHRPGADGRSGQKPEILRDVAYRADIESRSPQDDESRILFDHQTDVVEWVVLNPKASWLKSVKVVIENAGSPPDDFWQKRTGQNVADNNKVVNAAGEYGEWKPCGPAQAGPESSKTPTPTTTLDVKISLTPPNTPPKGETSTPSKNVTPGTPGTQPPEKTQPPVTPITETKPPETKTTPTITSQPAISTSVQVTRPAGTPTAVPRPIDTPAPANTSVAVTPTAFPQPVATKTPSAP